MDTILLLPPISANAYCLGSGEPDAPQSGDDTIMSGVWICAETTGDFVKRPKSWFLLLDISHPRRGSTVRKINPMVKQSD